jgi:aspartate beta-hydroxylase
MANIFKKGLLTTSNVMRPRPTMFFMPGLDQRPLHDPSAYKWTGALEGAIDTIRAEFLEGLKHAPTSDYATEVNDRPDQMLHTGDWEWHSLISGGKRQDGFAQHCPQTAMMLESIDDLQLGTPFSYAFFSVLKPGASIATHSAPCNIRLRCHLPLFVPDVPVGTCAMRVGDQFVQVRGGRGEREGCTVQCGVFGVVCSVLCVLHFVFSVLYSVFQQLWLVWCLQCAAVFAVCAVGGVLIVLRMRQVCGQH